jgi:hypothetical protein
MEQLKHHGHSTTKTPNNCYNNLKQTTTTCRLKQQKHNLQNTILQQRLKPTAMSRENHCNNDKSEAESSPKPYPTATSLEKHYCKQPKNIITTRESTESQELAGTLANTTSHRSRSRGRGGRGGAEEGLDPDPQRGGREKGEGGLRSKSLTTYLVGAAPLSPSPDAWRS